MKNYQNCSGPCCFRHFLRSAMHNCMHASIIKLTVGLNLGFVFMCFLGFNFSVLAKTFFHVLLDFIVLGLLS